MKPSVGRLVHYTNLGDKDGKYPPQVQAALITAVYRTHDFNGKELPAPERIDSGTPTEYDVSERLIVDLKIFYPTGLFDMQKVPFSETPLTRGHWGSPPKVY